jgi:hypothetical protein
MRLVDFLILVLEAHGRTLQRLAALFGEEPLLELLELAGENTSEDEACPALGARWFTAPSTGGSPGAAYAELESSVHDLSLAAQLEFHVWAYPHYRAFIESPLELGARLASGGQASEDPATAVIDEAVARARDWLKKLPIPPELWNQAESAASVSWVRFRTEALKKAGRRPLGAL